MYGYGIMKKVAVKHSTRTHKHIPHSHSIFFSHSISSNHVFFSSICHSTTIFRLFSLQFNFHEAHARLRMSAPKSVCVCIFSYTLCTLNSFISLVFFSAPSLNLNSIARKQKQKNIIQSTFNNFSLVIQHFCIFSMPFSNLTFLLVCVCVQCSIQCSGMHIWMHRFDQFYWQNNNKGLLSYT